MGLRLGINPITWTNDDLPSLGGDTPVETCLAETREAGFAGTEMGGKFPKTSAALRPLLDRHGLVLVSGWYDGRIHEKELSAEWDAILPHLTLLNECGCRHVVYADTSGRSEGDLFAPISRRPKLADGDWNAYGKRLTALAEKMADFGVGMAFHHHMGTIVETDAEVDRLIASTGRGSRSSLRLRPLDLFGRRPDRAAAPSCCPRGARTLQGCAAGHPEACPRQRTEFHAGGARRRLHHARGRHDRFSRDFRDPEGGRLLRAGSWRRPSRTPPRRIRSPTPGWASAISPGSLESGLHGGALSPHERDQSRDHRRRPDQPGRAPAQPARHARDASRWLAVVDPSAKVARTSRAVSELRHLPPPTSFRRRPLDAWSIATPDAYHARCRDRRARSWPARLLRKAALLRARRRRPRHRGARPLGPRHAGRLHETLRSLMALVARAGARGGASGCAWSRSK